MAGKYQTAIGFSITSGKVSLVRALHSTGPSLFLLNPMLPHLRISGNRIRAISPMTFQGGSEKFYGAIRVFRGFARLMEPSLYSPLPGDWIVGVADIVDSTKAIAAKRYKAVNMAGAAVIAAVTNAFGGREFPFVFGGDGASFAGSSDDAALAREALAATAAGGRESTRPGRGGGLGAK